MLTIEQTRRGQSVQELLQALNVADDTADGRLAALFFSPLTLAFRNGVKVDLPIFPVEPSTNALDSEVNAYNAAVAAYYQAFSPLTQGFNTQNQVKFFDLSGNTFVTLDADGATVKLQVAVTGLRPQIIYYDRS